MEIWRREANYLPVPKKFTNETLAQRMAAYKVPRVPTVVLKSDRSDFIACRIDDLTTSVVQRIVTPTVEYCADNGLYLEDDNVD
jgi:hypothetical protein